MNSPQVPRKVADAIYGRIQGAEYSSSSELWLLPCNQEGEASPKGRLRQPLTEHERSEPNHQAGRLVISCAPA